VKEEEEEEERVEKGGSRGDREMSWEDVGAHRLAVLDDRILKGSL